MVKDFYNGLVGEIDLTAATLGTGFRMMIDIANKSQMSLYEANFPGASPDDSEWLKTQILYQPRNLVVEAGADMGLSDEDFE